MTFIKPEKAYWERKLIAYLHDPLDKVFQVQGHEERAAKFLEKYGSQKPNEEFWKTADVIAAGFERGQVPSYSRDETRNGAVDFLENPVITHPTSAKASLKVVMSKSDREAATRISESLLEFIETEIGMKPGGGGYSDAFKGDGESFAFARFLYTHLALRFSLAENNVGGLGAFWHRVPADSRFPDHSIWQHNALCSAICSCIELGKDISEVGMMVFSITPVQAFIAKARKLRDYWTGSVLLSWLSFEGIRWVVENLGPDHILYPSLIDQPLMNKYLHKRWKIPEEGFLNPPKDLASLPNKFVFLLPMSDAQAIGEEIERHIVRQWKALCGKVSDTCISIMGNFLSNKQGAYIKSLFDRQNRFFWEMKWAAAFLVSENDRKEVDRLLPQSAYEESFTLLEAFNRIIADKPHYERSGRGVLYSVSHSIAQSALAACKIEKTIQRIPENGEKCHLCGEFEALHHEPFDGMSAGEYKEKMSEFWRHLKNHWDGDEGNELSFNLNPNEKLCSICLTKRMAGQALESDPEHILHGVLSGRKAFPSTTDMALTGRFEREQTPWEERRKIAEQVHRRADDRTDSRDRYYAILIMDGDNMGKLVNGETLASTWESVMHPEILRKLKEPSFERKYRENWKDIFKYHGQRQLTPAIHAAISESLGDFSLYGVSSIVNRSHGRLIYAGGDDVCAVLPVETALKAAYEIQAHYSAAFKVIQRNSAPKDVSGEWRPEPGKLSINLGKGEHISISAAILLCHHKEILRQMILRAHQLLEDRAKKMPGKNACAIELRKRSGGSRFFVRKWEEEPAWRAFLEIGSAIKSGDTFQVSASLVYRLEQMREGIEAILRQENYKTMLQDFFLKQLERSSVGIGDSQRALAEKMTEIVICGDGGGGLRYEPEGLIVAAFMSKGGA